MENFLQFKNIEFSYYTKTDEIKALTNLNFNIKQKEFISIVGPSGCGKTTILSLISDLLTPSSGEILLNNKKIRDNQNAIGYMFQKDHLFEWRNVWKNIILGLEIQHKNKEIVLLKNAENLLKKYGLYKFKNHKPSQLSGGMRQRVSLIRTLALNPDLLLLDEPFSSLDFQTKLSVIDDVSNIIKKENKTAILVTHDISEAISLSDRVIILTQRPATVKKIVNIDLKKYGTPLQRRESEEFRNYFDVIWKELQYEKE